MPNHATSTEKIKCQIWDPEVIQTQHLPVCNALTMEPDKFPKKRSNTGLNETGTSGGTKN